MIFNMGVEVILENFEDLIELFEDKQLEVLDVIKDEVFDLLEEELCLEFLNCIDECIMFLLLIWEEIKQIFYLLL